MGFYQHRPNLDSLAIPMLSKELSKSSTTMFHAAVLVLPVSNQQAPISLVQKLPTNWVVGHGQV